MEELIEDEDPTSIDELVSGEKQIEDEFTSTEVEQDFINRDEDVGQPIEEPDEKLTDKNN